MLISHLGIQTKYLIANILVLVLFLLGEQVVVLSLLTRGVLHKLLDERLPHRLVATSLLGLSMVTK